VPYQRVNTTLARIPDEGHGPALLGQTQRVVLHSGTPADVAGDDDEGVASFCGRFGEGVLCHGFAAAMRAVLGDGLWEQSAKWHASSARGAAVEYVADASKEVRRRVVRCSVRSQTRLRAAPRG